MELTEFINRLPDAPVRKGNRYQCKCPAHQDKRSSLSVTEAENGNILVKCFAGCSATEITAAMGLTVADLFKDKEERPANVFKQYEHDGKTYRLSPYFPREISRPVGSEWKLHEVINHYPYYDEQGELQYYILRTIPKAFIPCVKVVGGYVNSLLDRQRILYRLPEITAANKEERQIIIVGGEKDVENLVRIGFEATTCPFGEGNWRPEYNRYFKGANVVIIPDNDNAGEIFARTVSHGILNIVSELRIVRLPDLPDKGDVSDWLNFGGNAPQLMKIIRNTPTEAQRLKMLALEEEKEKERIDQSNKGFIEAIRETIYEETYKGPKLIHKFVAEAVIREFNIKAAQLDNSNKLYLQYKDGYWQRVERDYIGGKFSNWLYDHDCTSKTINDITGLIPKLDGAFVNIDSFNSDPNKLNLANGVFDLSDYTFEPHTSKQLFTYKNDYEYNSGAQCPTFDAALWDFSCRDADWIRLFWQIIGYSLTGIFPYQKMFWFTGSKGRNGKGTLLRIIERLVGDHYTMAGFKLKALNDRFYGATMIGKRIITTGDMPNFLCNVASLKQLTGGDKQTVEIKFKDAQTYTSYAKLIFAMNQLPKFPESENITPVRKRIIILPFDFEIKKPDSTVEQVYMSEISGIFNRAIEGLKDLMEHGEFATCERGEMLLDNYAGSGSTFLSFVENNIVEDPNGRLFYYQLWQRYQKYMDINAPNWNRNDYYLRTEFMVRSKFLETYPDTKIEYILLKNSTSGRRGRYAALCGFRLKREADREVDYLRLLFKKMYEDEIFNSKPYFEIREILIDMIETNDKRRRDMNVYLYTELVALYNQARQTANILGNLGMDSIQQIYELLRRWHSIVENQTSDKENFMVG